MIELDAEPGGDESAAPEREGGEEFEASEFQDWIDRAHGEEYRSASRSRSPPPPLPLAEPDDEPALAPPLPVAVATASRSAGSQRPMVVASAAADHCCPLAVPSQRPLVVASVAAHGGPFTTPLGGRLVQTRSQTLSRLWSPMTAGRVTASLPPSGRDPYEFARGLVDHTRRAFYVGITENPVARWRSDHQRRFEHMVVCYEASSSFDTSALERRLIRHCLNPDGGFLSFGNRRCLNAGLGGEHASCGSPHYLYIAYRADALTRR